MKAKTEMIRQQSEDLRATVMMRASDDSYLEFPEISQGNRDLDFNNNNNSFEPNLSAEDLLHVIDDNDNPTIVEVYHSISEAKAAHKQAKQFGSISLGLDVNDMINRKNEHSVCSTIRLKIWSRFCEPCVEEIEDEEEAIEDALMIEAQAYEYDISK